MPDFCQQETLHEGRKLHSAEQSHMELPNAHTHPSAIYRLPQFITHGVNHTRSRLVLQLPFPFQRALPPQSSSKVQPFQLQPQVIFKVKCHLCCSIDVFLHHLTVLWFLDHYLSFHASLMTFLKCSPKLIFPKVLWIFNAQVLEKIFHIIAELTTLLLSSYYYD